MTSTVPYETVSGSPYYSTSYVKSTVILKDGNYVNLPLRYDLFQDEIEFMKENKMMWVLKKDINYIKYGEKEIIAALNDFEFPGKLSYYFLPVTGDNKLFIKKQAEYLPEVPPKGYAETVPDRFETRKDEYYIQLGDAPVQRIKNKKALETLLAGNNRALDFIKKEKTKSDKAEDLEKLVKFLNGKE